MVYTLSGVRFPTVPSLHKSPAFTSNADRRNPSVSVFLKKHSVSRKIFAYEPESRSSTVAASEKVLVPGGQSDSSLSSTEQLEVADTVPKNALASTDVDSSEMEHASQIKAENGDVEPASGLKGNVEELDFASQIALQGVRSCATSSEEDVKLVLSRELPFGNRRKAFYYKVGTKASCSRYQSILNIEHHSWEAQVKWRVRFSEYKKMREAIDKYEGGLEAFSRGYEKKGFTRSATGITYREWAPGAKWAALIGDFNNWNPNADIMTRNEFGVWEIFLPNNADGSPAIPHGPRVKLKYLCQRMLKNSF
ncbi:1,4-alpha-glucan-branching enzyme 1, chloroplastic/amyloplastic-like [Nicotiana tabacum]|uniref:1,4-alpha-glucan-branching enzyme 1, chloroplastic/amyloplastic-like n=1 Tax=Nicotiana tabacum TaxID=4097 RepID=A0AC58TF24_TOBAC